MIVVVTKIRWNCYRNIFVFQRVFLVMSQYISTRNIINKILFMISKHTQKKMRQIILGFKKKFLEKDTIGWLNLIITKKKC